MNVLITGASGFIGRHVVSAFSSSFPQSFIYAGCRRPAGFDMQGVKNVVPVHHDIWDEGHDITFAKPYDVIIHLSWPLIHKYNDVTHLDEVLSAQKRFVDQALDSSKNITIAGTCFEYGLQEGKLTEDLKPRPVTAYGSAKDELRKYIFNELKAQVKWLRIFYVYGEGQSEFSIIPQLEKAIAEKNQYFNMSPGQQVRDYIRVEDLAKMIVELAVKTNVNGVFNCCSNNPVTLENFIKNYLDKNHPQSEIMLNLGFFSYNTLEPLEFWGDNSKLIKAISSTHEIE